MTVHSLKTVKPHYEDILNLRKTFEIRFNDRKFKVGDILILQEFHLYEKNKQGGRYSGRQCEALVIGVTRFPDGLRDGFVGLSIRRGFWENGIFHTFDHLDAEWVPPAPDKKKNDFGSDLPPTRYVHGWAMSDNPYRYSIPWNV